MGGVGRAIIGGIFAGATGAIVGANTRKSKNIIDDFSIQIITNEIDKPLYEIKLINAPLDKNANVELYNQAIDFANNIYATVQSIISKKGKLKVDTNGNYTKELEKLAELKEKGIITQQEFEESKKKILSKL